MPKLTPNGPAMKISLDQIVETGNIREDYTDIEELAASIKQHGLIQPIVVKKYKQSAEGVQLYELTCGHRRVRAYRLLCEKGDDFSMIDAFVKTGDKHTLQLIENLQRSDLSSAEKERAVMEMLNDGHTQTEISDALCKPASWVSDLLAAYRVRQKADAAGVDASAISSKALGQLRSVDEVDIPYAIGKTLELGGTLAAATRVLKEYRGEPVSDEPIAAPVARSKPSEPEAKAPAAARIESQPVTRQAAQEKDPAPIKVPLTSVFDCIHVYINRLEKKVGDMDKEHVNAKEERAKIAAAREIIELLQTSL
jgi:ParB/RepB/Spo0J family partition protein